MAAGKSLLVEPRREGYREPPPALPSFLSRSQPRAFDLQPLWTVTRSLRLLFIPRYIYPTLPPVVIHSANDNSTPNHAYLPRSPRPLGLCCSMGLQTPGEHHRPKH